MPYVENRFQHVQPLFDLDLIHGRRQNYTQTLSVPFRSKTKDENRIDGQRFS